LAALGAITYFEFKLGPLKPPNSADFPAASAGNFCYLLSLL
jgi:hypothetical protein